MVEQNYHRLLKRQIQKHLKTIDQDNPEIQNLLFAVSEAYASFNNDHIQLERTLDLSSNELFKANERLNKYNEELETKVGERTKELENSRAYLDNILNAVANPIFVKDAEHKFVMLNDAMCELIGKSRNELLGKSDYDFFPKEQADVFWAKDEEVFKSKSENINEELLTDKNNIIRTILTKKTIFTDVSGNDCLVGTITDLTDRKEMEEELRVKNEILTSYSNELERINKELDQFAYIVSHDLKAPLRAISNLSMWIEEDIEDKIGEETKKNLELLRGRVQRMEDLINGILEYSRAGRTKTTLSELNTYEFVKDIVDNLAPPENFEITISDDLPTGKFDKLAMEQIFQNLISNAIKYNRSDFPTISITFKNTEKSYIFCVSDNGNGIDKQFHDKIFVIFQTLQARDKFESTGVGLAIVKKIIEEKGGKIWVESEIGKGAKFYFEIPKNK
ncbi:MAG TPA: PAS domain-containing sensor histidine kinase [Bacteroidetes bacterium]|nr:PAS domain S-box protein [Ignavibacteria bacterium]HCA43187.1 PAS domain-containing sensor histidine kinase [Bacteroidota bacterium]HCN37680.1 PAS domain-containing sensor histidine kinase [Bacteroidota bacterium]